MEVNDNSNSSNQLKDDGDQNRIAHQLLRLNISGESKQLFWYDIRNFPDALLIEILVRLPVKSIFMFKSVCKHWQTLISDPSFRRLYSSILNSNAALSSRPFRILDKSTWVPNLKEFLTRLRAGIHSSSEFSALFLSISEELQRPTYNQFKVLDMSNGLILCRSVSLVYYICDPLTGQWISIPRWEHGFRDYLVRGLITRVSEDHMLTGYTAVKVDFLASRSNYLGVQMYSSETGQWIHYKVPCVIPSSLRKEGGCPIHCYGALHWRVSYRGTHGMIAFDPYKDQNSVRLIPLPNDRAFVNEAYKIASFQLCGESQGTLRFFEVAKYPSQLYLFTMWAMKDYEKGEWCCESKVRRSDLHSTDPELSNWLLESGYFLPLSFHPLNPNVVYLTCMWPKQIVSYDVLNRRLDFAFRRIGTIGDIAWKSVFPFVVPRWPGLLSVASLLPFKD